MSSPNPAGKRQPLARAMKLPLVSGKVSALVLVVCFVLTAVLIPMALRLERWLEYEIVLATWWLVWAVTLTLLLHRRHRVSHDYQWREPRKWFSWKEMGKWFQALDIVDVPSGNDSLGAACLVVLVIIIAIPLLVVLAWVVIEIALPAVAFVMYFVVRGMLARVANDWHGCQGNWPRSVLWGTIWATIYTLPLALVVWSIHKANEWHAAHYL